MPDSSVRNAGNARLGADPEPDSSEPEPARMLGVELRTQGQELRSHERDRVGRLRHQVELGRADPHFGCARTYQGDAPARAIEDECLRGMGVACREYGIGGRIGEPDHPQGTVEELTQARRVLAVQLGNFHQDELGWLGAGIREAENRPDRCQQSDESLHHFRPPR